MGWARKGVSSPRTDERVGRVASLGQDRSGRAGWAGWAGGDTGKAGRMKGGTRSKDQGLAHLASPWPRVPPPARMFAPGAGRYCGDCSYLYSSVRMVVVCAGST